MRCGRWRLCACVLWGVLAVGPAGPVRAEVHANAQADVLVHKGPGAFIQVAGDPVLLPMDAEGTVHRVANASGPLFFAADPASFWTRLGPTWVAASDLEGPYERRRGVPRVLADLPQPKVTVAPAWDGRGPAPVFVRTRRTVFVQLTGPLQLERAGAAGGLHVVASTDADLFFHGQAARYYLLAGGQWYSATGLDGPWAPADDVRARFADLTADHPRGYVLAAIPGTREHDAAVQGVARTSVKKVPIDGTVHVTFAGAPQFAAIADTGVSYAVNTSQDVFETGGLYYCCEDGVWYLAAAPAGPWSVCALVPDALYTIPPNHAKHPVTAAVMYPAAEPGQVMVGTSPAYEGWRVVDDAVVHRSWYGPWPQGRVYEGQYFGPFATAGYLAEEYGNWGRGSWQARPRTAVSAALDLTEQRKRVEEPATDEPWYGDEAELEQRRRGSRNWP